MKTAIVTGASGFIGRALVRELLENGYFIYAVGREGSCQKIPQSERLVFVACDLAEIGKLPEMPPAGPMMSFSILPGRGVPGAAATSRYN